MNDIPRQLQFQSDDILFCAMAVRVFNVEVADIKLALQRSIECMEDVARSLVVMELMDESEVRALKKLLDSTPEAEHASEPHSSLAKRFDAPAPGNRYRELYEHDVGGMGRILVVEDKVLGRQVALKEAVSRHMSADTSHPSSSMASIGIERFRREALITAQLEHPAIVPVYDLGNRNGELYYTMKFIRGKSFFEAVKKGHTLKARLPLLRSLVDVSQALAFAHSQGVVHRDVTPWNVMLGEFGETVVLDWGLAKRTGEGNLDSNFFAATTESWKTQNGSLLGTPQYMAPEQALGRTEVLDERTDVFAVGTLLYLLLTAQPPYSARTPEVAIALAISGKIVPVRQLEPNAPNELITIAEKSMARDPAKRYQTMEELRDELIRFQDGSFLRSHRYGISDFVLHYYRHHRLSLAAVSSSLIGFLVVTLVAYLNVVEARDIEAEQRAIAESSRAEEAVARRLAQDEALRAELRLAQEHMSNGDYTHAEATLDEVTLAQRGPEWDLLRTLASPESLLLSTPGEAILGARFDPTGKWIATIGNANRACIWDAQTGKMVGSEQVPSKSVASFSFRGDGMSLAVVTTAGVTYLYSVPDAKLRWEAPSVSPALSVAFSPDQSSVLVGYNDGSIRRWKQEDGSLLREVNALAGPVSTLSFLTPDLVATSNPTGVLMVVKYPSFELAYQKELSEPLLPLANGLAVASKDAGIVVFEAATGQDRVALAGGIGKNALLRADSTSRFVVSTVVGGPSTVWDLQERAIVRHISSSEFFVDAFVVANPLRVISCGGGGMISLWTGTRTEPIYRRRARDASIGMCDFSARTMQLLTCGGGENCATWNIAAPNGSQPILFDKSPSGYSIDHVDNSDGPKPKVGIRFNGTFMTFALAPIDSRDDLTFLVLDKECNGAVTQFLWDDCLLFTLSPSVLATWDGAVHNLVTYRLNSGVALSATPIIGSTKRFAAGTDTGEIYVFDPTKEAADCIRLDRTSPITALTSSNDGRRLLLGTGDGALIALSLDALAQVHSRNSGHGRVVGITCLPSENACIVGFASGVVAKWYWDIDRIDIAPTMTGKRTDALCLGFGANTVLVSSRFDPLEAYNLDSLRQVFVLPKVRSLELLPSKDCAIISDQYGVVWRQKMHWRNGKRLAAKPQNAPSRSPHSSLNIHCYLKTEQFHQLYAQIQRAEELDTPLIEVLSTNPALASVFQTSGFPEDLGKYPTELQLTEYSAQGLLAVGEVVTISVHPMDLLDR